MRLPEVADGGGDMITAFKPDRSNTRALRDAFGRFASGVTIVTAPSKDGPVGITASSFSSLSLDPPLVLWSPDTGSYRFPYFENASQYAIHVLGAEQVELCRKFTETPFAFEDADVEYNEHNVPLINGCLARFECKQTAMYPGGDHKIVVGEVVEVQMRDGDSLAFFGGQLLALESG